MIKVEYSEVSKELFGEAHPAGLGHSAFPSAEKIETSLLVTEFKDQLSDLITELLDGTKAFDESELVIAWDLGSRFTDGLAGEYELRSISYPEIVADRPYFNAKWRPASRGYSAG